MKEPLDFTNVMHELEGASLFDLYRLSVAIYNVLDDPDRIERVRAALRPGMPVRYFDDRENRTIDAEVVSLERTRLVVRNLEDQQNYSIRFCMVDLEGRETEIHAPPKRGALTRNMLKVGDPVGFLDRQNREVFGVVEKLNRKTAAIVAKNGMRWRVAYPLLFKGIEPRRSGAGHAADGRIELGGRRPPTPER